MFTEIDIKTDEKLLEALRRAKSHVVTGDELMKQRVSWVMGMMKPESTVTREQVERLVAEQYGVKG